MLGSVHPPTMKTVSPRRSSSRSGITLLELTVVIAVILSLTTILLIGARAWKGSADRSACIMNIRNVQVSVRSYQNMYGYNPGGMPYAEGGTQDIATHMHEKGYITDSQFSAIEGEETCPGGGEYHREHADAFPSVGDLYIECSYSATKDHLPDDGMEW